MNVRLLAGALGCAALAALGCQPAPPASGSSSNTTVNGLTAQPTSVSTQRRDIVGADFFSGNVFVPPYAESSVVASYAAPVENVMVTIGQRVGKGASLVTLSLPSQQGALEQAKLTLQSAQAAYKDAMAKYGGPLRDAQAQLAQARSSLKDAQNKAAVDPSTDVSAATNSYQDAQDAVIQARADLNSNAQPYLQQLEAAQQAYADAKAGAKMATIRAPISGTVVALNASPGQQASQDPGKPVASIVDLDDLQVRAFIKPDQLEDAKAGKKVKLTFARIPGESFDGEVESLNTYPLPQAQPNSPQLGWEAVISIRNDHGLVKPGTGPATCAIYTGRAANALVVPVPAVAQDTTGRKVVHELMNGAWQARVVETGLSDGKDVQITSGLSDGDVVQVPYQP